jgi:hypothetical protein
MLKGLKSALTRDRQQLPIVELDWLSGVRLAVTSVEATYGPQLGPGAYMISASAPVWLSVGREAGDAAGSIYLPAGMPYHTLMSYGGYVSARAVDGTASVSVIPIA